MKKLLTLALALMLVLSAIPFAFAEAELPQVAFICKGYQDTYCYLVSQKAKEYADANYADKFEVTLFDGEVDNDVINGLIETCTTNKFAGIIMQQNDPDAPVPSVKDAVDAGLFVIITVGSVNDDGESYYIDADPVQQGRLLTDYATEQGVLKEGTKVGLLRGIDGTFHADGRHQGYVEGCEAVGAVILDDQTGNWKTSEAQPIVEGWLTAYPEIEVIFSANDDMALGAINAMKAMDRMDIKVYSVDANELGCLAVVDGTLSASVAQDTFGYAETPVDYMATLLDGGTVESIRLDSTLVTQDNVDEILSKVHNYTDEQIAALK